MPWGLGIRSPVRSRLSRTRIRSRIPGSNHFETDFAFLPLSLLPPWCFPHRLRSCQVSGSVRSLGASPLGAPTTSDLWVVYTAHVIYPTSLADRILRLKLLRLSPPRLPLLPLRSPVTPRALDIRRQSFPPAHHAPRFDGYMRSLYVFQ
jgi:hypothetical protein